MTAASPSLRSRWIHRDCRRSVVVVGIRGEGAGPWFVEYRYVQGLSGSNLWRRGITPTQEVSLDDWTRRFEPEKEKRR